MKFQLDEQQGGNSISRHDGQCVCVNGQPWRGEVQGWNLSSFDAFSEAHFEQILAHKPELVILGTGQKLRFVKPALYRSLIQAGIGMETMDLGAACRTYNVLASEGRAVLAALLIEA